MGFSCFQFQHGVHHALNPDLYRGVFGLDGEKYAKDVKDLINCGTCDRVGGFNTEAIHGVGGILELARGYLPTAYSSVKEAGRLCIADEVQFGFARTGSYFWGFKNQGVVPDIVTMTKVYHPDFLLACPIGLGKDTKWAIHERVEVDIKKLFMRKQEQET